MEPTYAHKYGRAQRSREEAGGAFEVAAAASHMRVQTRGKGNKLLQTLSTARAVKAV